MLLYGVGCGVPAPLVPKLPLSRVGRPLLVLFVCNCQVVPLPASHTQRRWLVQCAVHRLRLLLL